VLNPQILPQDLTGKAIELDVLARDARGRLFNVEVQVQRFPRWSARSAFYLSRLLASQIDAGQAYLELKPVVGVHLLDFELFDDHPSALWHFEMRDRHDPSVRLGDELSLHVVELRKADRAWRGRGDDGGVGGGRSRADILASADPAAALVTQSDRAADAVHGALHAWIAFLKRWKEAKEMSDLAYPPVQQALKKLQDLSRNEEDRYRAIARERALYNELTLLRDAREEGREEGLLEGVRKGLAEGVMQGLQEGRQEGRQEGLTLAKTATLTRQLTRRFGALPDWASKRVQEASGEQIDAWLDRILDAPTLQLVFDDRRRLTADG
jgi:predicted transposase/invertase (TIGR01784 family)